MNMNHTGPVNIKSGSVVLVDDLEEHPSVPQMNQDPSLAEPMCRTQSQPEVEGYYERLKWSHCRKTISSLRWSDIIKKLTSKLMQVISDLSTANSKWKKEEIEMETSWWTWFGFAEHQSSLRWVNMLDCRDSTQQTKHRLPGSFR